MYASALFLHARFYLDDTCKYAKAFDYPSHIFESNNSYHNLQFHKQLMVSLFAVAVDEVAVADAVADAVAEIALLFYH
jgi:hypothetical protein